MLNWIKNHFNSLCQIQLNTRVTDKNNAVLSIDEGFQRYIHSVKSTRETKNKIMIIGNGGSAGIASHMAIDYSKNGRLPAMTFTDASAITCLSNDYGYEHIFSKQIEYHGRPGDVLLAISSSGKSQNILNAVASARSLNCGVITFSGFDANNPLSKLGDVNFYVDSKEYGVVEVAHLSLAHAMLDYLMQQESLKPSHLQVASA